MLLSAEEKTYFVKYLTQNVESSKAMLDQFKSLPMGIPEPLVEREKKKIAAYLTVIADLMEGEESTL